ncbi:hypothetical protein JB92DRAFT_2836595 [Gautieria morchelliformis]|nr:hypothetical protein JB92DRAFT_2836595 [Gautieria morchelliformis]
MEGVNIPKPKGMGSHNFNIHEHLRLNTGEEDNKQIHKEILPMQEQDNRKVSLAVHHVLEECPAVDHFKCIWPIEVLIQQFPKNSLELNHVSAQGGKRSDWPECSAKEQGKDGEHKPNGVLEQVSICEQNSSFLQIFFNECHPCMVKGTQKMTAKKAAPKVCAPIRPNANYK